MTPNSVHRIRIDREVHKFAAAHMTVFPDGTKEALHGHNYRVALEVELADISLPKMVSFAVYKDLLKSICARWDEKLLLPERCPHFQLARRDATELEFRLCGKRYVIPADEAELLPLDNITTETLAAEVGRLFVAGLDSRTRAVVKSIEVQVEESPGQGASFEQTL